MDTADLIIKSSTDFYNDPIDDITYEDITYKKRNGLSLKLDLYENNNETKPKPVIIYVFGDAWIKGEQVIPSAISPLIELLKEEGYAVISTSYELMKEEIRRYKQNNNSIGGTIATVITGIEIGLGEPFFDSVESYI